MEQDVRHTTETFGTVRETKALFNGQDNTREYTPEEKAKITGIERPKTVGMEWMDLPNDKVDSFVKTTSDNGEKTEIKDGDIDE